jgi:16S rRNA (guanine1207-N2)-methyltransferase
MSPSAIRMWPSSAPASAAETMPSPGAEAVYGSPLPVLAPVSKGAIQTSPLVVGARGLESLADGTLPRVVIEAPPGTLERRYALAHGLRALATGGELLALARKDMGGSRLARELRAFGCMVSEAAKRHHRICRCLRPAAPLGLEAAIAAGGLQRLPALGLWSQPGVFSWNRIDPGSAILMAQPWRPAGAGADLGCGLGVLSRAVLASPTVTELTLIDIDRRAVEAARLNVGDARARFLQHDLRRPPRRPTDLDFVVMNPPFHDGGSQDRSLGHAFVDTAAAMLKVGGVLRMVANVALPYESILAGRFSAVDLLAQAGGYKLFEARR